MEVMDKVDQQQQHEIDQQRIWIKAIAVLLMLVSLMGLGLFIALTKSLDCPHPNCPHSSRYVPQTPW